MFVIFIVKMTLIARWSKTNDYFQRHINTTISLYLTTIFPMHFVYWSQYSKQIIKTKTKKVGSVLLPANQRFQIVETIMPGTCWMLILPTTSTHLTHSL